MMSDFPLSARLADADDSGRSQISAAAHETGHILVARLTGIRPIRVDLKADSSGQAWDAGGPIEAELVVLRAGQLAEQEIGARDPGTTWDCSRSDRQKTAGLADRLDPRRPLSAVARADGQALEFLRKHWSAVERFAVYLLWARRLEGRELAAALDCALAGSPDVRAAVTAQLAREASEAEELSFRISRRQAFEASIAGRTATDAERLELWEAAGTLAKRGDQVAALVSLPKGARL